MIIHISTPSHTVSEISSHHDRTLARSRSLQHALRLLRWDRAMLMHKLFIFNLWTLVLRVIHPHSSERLGPPAAVLCPSPDGSHDGDAELERSSSFVKTTAKWFSCTGALLLLPLLRRKALWRPSMYGSNLSFQRRVDQSMAGQSSLLCELRRHDDGLVHLAAAS